MQKTCTNQRRVTQWHHCFHVCYEAEESDNSNINTESHDVTAAVDLTTLMTVVISLLILVK